MDGQCPDGYTCSKVEHLVANAAGFDNIFVSMLTVFQCITVAGWSYVMYRSMDGTNQAAVVYYLLVVMFGAFFMMNLFLAVIKLKFARAQLEQELRERENERTRKDHKRVSVIGSQVAKLSKSRQFTDPVLQ